MSRCFPFPPPGYEKKAKSDDVGLLKKEEDREKKHKEEKKDREKREGKEKREKDRSDGNHWDKKDKKEKHRDKKEKDRHKDRDKSSASDEKRLPGLKHNDGDKPSDGKRLPGQPKDSNGDKASDEKKLPGQSKRHDIGGKPLDVRKFPGKPEGNGGEIFTQKEKERGINKNSISGEKNQFSDYNGQKLSQNSNYAHHPMDPGFVQETVRRTKDEGRHHFSAQHPMDPEFVQESGRRTKDEDRHHFIEKFTGTDAKRDEGMVRLLAKAPGTWVEGKEKNKKSDDRKLEWQAVRDGASFIRSAQSLYKTVQTKIDGMPRPLEKDIEKKMEEKEKVKEKEVDDKRGDKLKDKDKEKKGKGKDKERDKEKKKKEKAKEKSKHKKTEPDKLKENNKADLVGNHIVKTSHPPNQSNSAVAEGNVKKRKDTDTNGFLHANDIKPNKLPRHTSSLHQPTENGRLLETRQTPTPFVPGRHGAVSSPKIDNKEHKKNGLIEAQALSITTMPPVSLSLTKSSHAAEAEKITEVFRKQPHPDSKYLNEVLKVPKMEECSDFDDQDWLFQSSNSQAKKPKVGSAGVNETPQVWSEALQIESADVCALPYVIPY